MKVRFISRLALIAFVGSALLPLCRAQAQIAGDWLGTLNAGGAQLRLALHIAAAQDGNLTATLDSIDQGARGIPVSSILLKGTAFSMTVDAVHGTYEGTVNKDATEIDGTWSQGQSLTLNFKRAPAMPAPAAAKPVAPSDIDGAWTGTLDAGAMQLHIILKIANAQDGLTVQMQSPDQSPVWLPASAVTRNGSALTIIFQGIGAKFAGAINPGLDTIDGTFNQMGNAIPLVLKKGKS